MRFKANDLAKLTQPVASLPINSLSSKNRTNRQLVSAEETAERNKKGARKFMVEAEEKAEEAEKALQDELLELTAAKAVLEQRMEAMGACKSEIRNIDAKVAALREKEDNNNLVGSDDDEEEEQEEEEEEGDEEEEEEEMLEGLTVALEQASTKVEKCKAGGATGEGVVVSVTDTAGSAVLANAADSMSTATARDVSSTIVYLNMQTLL